ncbi:MAG: DMT family transporter [Sulfurovum sp.]
MLTTYKYHIFLMLAVLFWSGNFVVGRFISGVVSPIELSFYRWFFVLVVLMPYYFIHFKRLNFYIKKYFFKILFLGVLSITFFNTFVYFGLQTTTATNALLINSSTPILIILLSSLILKKHLNKIEILGVVISTLGVLYVILKGNFTEILNLSITSGDLWILIAAFDWALYSVLLKFKPQEIKPFDFLFLITFFGVFFLSILFYGNGYEITSEVYENKDLLYTLIYIVIFPSILSIYFWNTGTIEIGANKAGQYANLMPIFGSIVAYFYLDEKIYTYHFVGLFLVLLGIYLTQIYKKKKKN